MNGWPWLRTPAATALLSRQVEANRRLDAQLSGADYERPCLTCGALAEFLGAIPVPGLLSYECPQGHTSLIDISRSRA